MIKIIISSIFKLPKFYIYVLYDFLKYLYLRQYREFFGWGIHLYVGRFGAGKTNTAVHYVYGQCVKYKQLSVLTNIKLTNFPTWTNVLELKTAQDILNAPANCIVLIDEIGTIFNSRDFSSGKAAVPKILFQHLCQCRKRHMQIIGTVQKYNLLDKQIRDISADVTVCKCSFKHPFTRLVRTYTYDVDEYDMYMSNRMYNPRLLTSGVYIQTNLCRNLYDTSELVDNMLDKEYLSDKEILDNRGDTSVTNTPFTRKDRKKIKRF